MIEYALIQFATIITKVLPRIIASDVLDNKRIPFNASDCFTLIAFHHLP